MKQQVHLVSLGVSDVAAARRFYCDGLGFELIADLDTVVFVQGGYSGYFKDPDGHIWEVASGGVAFDETGRAILG